MSRQTDEIHPTDNARPSRRAVIGGAGAVTAAALLSAGPASASPAAGAPAAGPARRSPAAPLEDLAPGFRARPGLAGLPDLRFRGRPTVDIREYGVDGSGSGSGGAAFSAAAAELGRGGGGVIRVPAGRYRFDVPADGSPAWTLPRRGVWVVGDGEASVIEFVLPSLAGSAATGPTAGSFTGWLLEEPEEVVLRDLSLSWTPFRLMRNTTPTYTLNATGGSGLYLLGLHLDQGQPGLWLPTGTNKWVVDCTVRNTSSDAIHFESGDHSTAAYNTVENATDDGIANFANTSVTPDTTATTDVVFVGNTVLGTAWGRGLTFGGTRQTMTDNWVESQVEAAIYTDVGLFAGAPPAALRDASALANTCVRTNLAQRADNQFYGFGTGGYQGAICLRDEVDGVTLADNRLLGSRVHGVTFGIEDYRPFSGTDVVLSGNTVERAARDGVRFLGTATASGVTGVRNTLLATGGPSVSVEGHLTGVRTSANRVSTAPRVTGSASGDLGGFTVVDTPAAYADVFAAASDAPDETAWARPPAPPDGSGPVVDVRSTGARGDGHHDDTAAFRRAVASLPRTGGTLHVPAGRYLLSPAAGGDTQPWTRIRHHLLVDGVENLTVRGTGGAVLVFADPDAAGLRVQGCSRVAVRGLAFRCAADRPLRRNRALLDLVASEGCTVTDLTLTASSGPGLLVDSCRSVLVRRVTVRDAGSYGIQLAASRQVVVRDCSTSASRDSGISVDWHGSISREPQFVAVRDNDVAATLEGPGIGVTGGDHVSVTGNTVVRSALAGVHLYSRSSNFPHRSVAVTDNRLVQTNSGSAVYTPGAISVHSIQQGRTSASVTVTGNTVLGTPHAGLWVGGLTPIGTVYSHLAALTTRGNRYLGTRGEAVSIDAAQRAQIDALSLGDT